MNVFTRFAVLLVLVSSYYIVAAEHASRSDRALRAMLADACSNGSGTSCDPDVASSGDYVAGKSELLKAEDLDYLKNNFRPFEQVAKDYPGFYDWSEKAKKEKDGRIKDEILALEKDMRQATLLAIELVSAGKKQELGDDSSEKADSDPRREESATASPSDESRNDAPKPQASPSPSQEPKTGPSKTGSAPIFKPNMLQIPLLRIALNNFVKNTNFKRDLGSDNMSFGDEKNVELLLGRIKERVRRFGRGIGLEETEDYPISRAGAPVNAEEYEDFPGVSSKE
ncbi:MAG: hypothetical protein R3B54_09375 [Bdellovibrionota bacterium]